jgi:hypothetical protein
VKKSTVKKSPRKRSADDSSPITFYSPTEPVLPVTLDVGTAFLNLIRTRRPFLVTGLEQWEVAEGTEDATTDDPTVTIESIVARAIRELCDKAPADEIARFRDVEQRVGKSHRLMLYDYGPGEFPEADLWLNSLFMWGTVLEKGEETVFLLLPSYLPNYCGFFLRQWWLSELLGRWYAQGERENIERLLFKSLERKGNFKDRMEERWRDWAIVQNMGYYQLVEKLGFNKALQQVHEEINREYAEQGKPLLKKSTVRTAYYRRVGKNFLRGLKEK